MNYKTITKLNMLESFWEFSTGPWLSPVLNCLLKFSRQLGAFSTGPWPQPVLNCAGDSLVPGEDTARYKPVCNKGGLGTAIFDPPIHQRPLSSSVTAAPSRPSRR